MRFSVVLVCAATLFLAGCYEDDEDLFSSDSSSTTSASFTAQPATHTSTCQRACEVQSQSQCAAADARYNAYVQNGNRGVDAATLSTLLSQYRQQAELAVEFVNVAC